MKRFLFIRHAATRGNLEKRYIGRTDEPIAGSNEHHTEAHEREMMSKDGENGLFFVSPMLRCIQTAEKMFPGAARTVVSDLRECDFGIFEGKTANELADCPEYAAWLETGCEGDIPGGESISEFKERCCRAFLDIAAVDGELAVVVTHGGVIMAVLERFGYPKRGFYDYHIPNESSISRVYENGRLVEHLNY